MSWAALCFQPGTDVRGQDVRVVVGDGARSRKKILCHATFTTEVVSAFHFVRLSRTHLLGPTAGVVARREEEGLIAVATGSVAAATRGAVTHVSAQGESLPS